MGMNKKSYRLTNVECLDRGGEGWGCLMDFFGVNFFNDMIVPIHPQTQARFIIMLKSSLFLMLSWCSCNTNCLLC